MAQNQTPFRDILAAVDPTASYSMPWLKGPHPIRPLTVREVLRLLVAHPSLAEMFDKTKAREAATDLVDVIGIPGLIAWASAGSGITEKQLAKLDNEAVLHAFVSVAEISLPTATLGALFPEPKPPKPDPKRRRPKKQDEAAVDMDSVVVRMIKNAVEYTIRTGRDGLDLSPVALGFATRILADIDLKSRQGMFQAVAAAMGDEASHDALGEL